MSRGCVAPKPTIERDYRISTEYFLIEKSMAECLQAMRVPKFRNPGDLSGGKVSFGSENLSRLEFPMNIIMGKILRPCGHRQSGQAHGICSTIVPGAISHPPRRLYYIVMSGLERSTFSCRQPSVIPGRQLDAGTKLHNILCRYVRICNYLEKVSISSPSS